MPPCRPSDRLPIPPHPLFDQAGVPLRHRRQINDDTSPKAWVNARDKILERLGSGFLIALIGKRGPGKTQIAQQAVLFATGAGRTALYTRAMSIFLELRATFASGDLTEASVIARYRDPRLLVIDEMQERGETPWENRTLNHLIDLRYGDMTDTLLIANLVPKALKASVGESIAERLRETGGILKCDWNSFRTTE